MRFSVVTISYNQGRFLERAIRSVLSQRHPRIDLQYIVVDPGSDDGSRELILSYKDEIDDIIFEPDGGPASGLNNGFRHASGEIFAFINADDGLLPGALVEVAEVFLRNPQIDVVYGHGLIVDKDGQISRRLRSENFNLRRLVLKANTILQQSVFVRSTAFKRAGGFNVANSICWDTELWVDLHLSGSTFLCAERYWSFMAMYDGTITSRLQNAALREKENQEFCRIATKAFPFEPFLFSGKAVRRARLIKYFSSPLFYIRRPFDFRLANWMKQLQPCLLTKQTSKFRGF